VRKGSSINANFESLLSHSLMFHLRRLKNLIETFNLSGYSFSIARSFHFIAHSHTLRNLNDWTIQLGMTRRHSHAHYGQKIKVKKVIPHPHYNDVVAHDNDIALFQVSSSKFP
jgi:Trypsin